MSTNFTDPHTYNFIISVIFVLVYESIDLRAFSINNFVFTTNLSLISKTKRKQIKRRVSLKSTRLSVIMRGT